MYTLSVIREEYIEKVVELAASFSSSIGFKQLSKLKVEQLLRSATDPRSDTYCVVLLEEMSPVGFLLGAVYTSPVSDIKLAGELGWFVLPEHRGTKLSWYMVRIFEGWAANKGAAFVSMVSEEASTTDPSRLYERLGYKLAEKTFVKEL